MSVLNAKMEWDFKIESFLLSFVLPFWDIWSSAGF